jgi:membrane protein
VVIRFGRDWMLRFVGVQGVDRAMALGAQAYTALIPLLIVYISLLPRADNQDFADVMIDEFKLRGATAQSVKHAFAPPSEVQSSVTALGVVLLVVSALSFTRGMQRLYEGAYDLENLGMRNTPRALLWLLLITVLVTVRPIALDAVHGWLHVALTLTLSTMLWLVTPYLLLGRRVSWQRLFPAALLTAIGQAGIGVWTVLWMPRLLASSAAQFGIIGIGFAMLTWLVAIAGAVVVATTGGALIADRFEAYRTREKTSP